MNQSLKVIINKELRRVFTDKRLIITLFVLPAVSLALIYSIIGYIAVEFMQDVKTHESTYVISDAPAAFKEVVDQIEDKAVHVQFIENAAIEDYKTQIIEGSLDMFVAFDPNFDEKVTQYESSEMPTIMTYYNYGEDYSEEAYQYFVNSLLPVLEYDVLSGRFGNMTYLEVYNLVDGSEVEAVINKEKATGKIISSILPMIISIFLFAGAMSVVMESVAGEKERGTMATLLVTPVKREVIAMGKMISLSIISTLTALSSLVGIAGTLGLLMLILPKGSGAGLDSLLTIKYTGEHVLQLVIFMLCLVGIYVGVIILLSAIAKTVKEAGTYITPVYMVVMVLSFMNMYSFNVEPLWKYAIPVYGQIIGIKEIFMYQMDWAKVGISTLSGVVLIGVLVVIIAKLFNSEKIIFTE